eukprot:2773557-Pyramimonas_sp.AAC.1
MFLLVIKSNSSSTLWCSQGVSAYRPKQGLASRMALRHPPFAHMMNSQASFRELHSPTSEMVESQKHQPAISVGSAAQSAKCLKSDLAIGATPSQRGSPAPVATTVRLSLLIGLRRRRLGTPARNSGIPIFNLLSCIYV